MKDLIYYGSYLAFPFLFFIFFKLKNKPIIIILMILTIIFIYSRFIETNIIKIRHQDITLGFNSKIILISDLHLGKYTKSSLLKKIVNKINSLDADYVMIAGDLTYEPSSKDLLELFKPLGNINKPTYWVLGNHDVEKPGPNIREELISSLDKLGLKYLNNNSIKLNNFILIGLGDNWNNEDNIKLLENYKKSDNIIVLTHNPDTTLSYTNNIADLTLCGHTHGGQIRIPFLYKKVIPTKGDFDRGLSYEKKGLLYTTSGIGTVGLPLRFLNPPVIDLLNIKK